MIELYAVHHEYGVDLFHWKDLTQFVRYWIDDITDPDIQRQILTHLFLENHEDAISLYFDHHPREYVERVALPESFQHLLTAVEEIVTTQVINLPALKAAYDRIQT